jgi:hypothetical protein
VSKTVTPQEDLANRVAYVVHMTGCSEAVATEAICEGDRELADQTGYVPATAEARLARDQPELAKRQAAKLAEHAARGPALTDCQRQRISSDVARDMQNENPHWRPHVGASSTVLTAADFAKHGARHGHSAYAEFCAARKAAAAS